MEYYKNITKSSWTTYKDEDFPKRKNLTNGCIYASVPSKNYKNVCHAVLINSVGRVIHDPHPGKEWLDHNVIKEKALKGWYIIKKRDLK